MYLGRKMVQSLERSSPAKEWSSAGLARARIPCSWDTQRYEDFKVCLLSFSAQRLSTSQVTWRGYIFIAISAGGTTALRHASEDLQVITVREMAFIMKGVLCDQSTSNANCIVALSLPRVIFPLEVIFCPQGVGSLGPPSSLRRFQPLKTSGYK